MQPIRVLLADDHVLVRAGIRALLEKMEGVEVIGEADHGQEALEFVRNQKPDIVFLDIGMPVMNGLEAAAHITADFPRVRVIMLSMHANEEYVMQSLQAGAVGYLLKDARKPELELAVKSVASGQTYLSPAVSKRVIENYVQSIKSESSPAEQLTPRQREILKWIAEGKSSKEISRILGISLKTVDTHRTQLMERLNIHDVVGLVHYAIRIGLINVK